MRSPQKHFMVPVDSIVVQRGEAFTVYLDTTALERADGRRAVQVELRVLMDGVIEVFSKEPITVKSFDEWTP